MTASRDPTHRPHRSASATNTATAATPTHPAGHAVSPTRTLITTTTAWTIQGFESGGENGLPIPRDGEIRTRVAEESLSHDPHCRPSENDRGVGVAPDNLDERAEFPVICDRAEQVVIVDVPHRDAHHIGDLAAQGRLQGSGGMCGVHQIDEPDPMSRPFGGVGDQAGAVGHDGDRLIGPVGGEDQDFQNGFDLRGIK